MYIYKSINLRRTGVGEAQRNTVPWQRYPGETGEPGFTPPAHCSGITLGLEQHSSGVMGCYKVRKVKGHRKVILFKCSFCTPLTA